MTHRIVKISVVQSSKVTALFYFLIMLLALTQSSCVFNHLVLYDEAIGQFSGQQTCPKDRITFQAVDVRPQDLSFTITPPADVAADPLRLAFWNQNVSNDIGHYLTLTAIDVTGCGAHRTYFCWNENPDVEAHQFCIAVNLDTPEAMFDRFRIDPSVRQRLDASAKKSPGFWH